MPSCARTGVHWLVKYCASRCSNGSLVALKVIILILLGCVIASLFSSFVFLFKDVDIPDSRRALYALGIRIAFAARADACYLLRTLYRTARARRALARGLGFCLKARTQR